MQGYRSAFVMAVVGALLLGGCSAGSDDDAEESASPTAEPTADSPEPTQPEEGDATQPPGPGTEHPDLEELVITTSGLGPLTVGDVPPSENPGAAMLTWVEDACVDFVEAEADPGLWVADYGPDTDYLGETVEPPFFIEASEQGIHRIDVMGATPATEEGIHIGSTLTELQETYPELEGPHEGPVSQVWWLQDESGSVAFETQSGDDILANGDADSPPPDEETVILIRVLAADWPPDFATANSGDVAGACF